MLSVSVQRDANISIHQQLVTQISLQIASGRLPEGAKLPSVRALSQKLKIHYNTCLSVYKELTQLGLVETKKGSGVIVSRFKSNASFTGIEARELHQMAKYFIQIVQEKGYTWEEVEAALQIARQQQESRQQQVAFVDIYPDILPVFQAELENALGMPVQAINLAELEPPLPKSDRLYIVSRYHYKALQARLPNEENILMIDVSAGQQEMALISALPEGALITIVSYSAIILQMAESVISGLRGSEVLFRSILYSEGLDEIQQAAKHSKLLVCDSLCAGSLEPFIKKKLSVIKLIPDAEIQKITQKLGH